MNISPSTSEGADGFARIDGQANRGSTPASLSPDVQGQIGRRLVAAYDHVLHQPVPDRFRLLLDDLDRKSQDQSQDQSQNESQDKSQDAGAGLPDAGAGSKGDSK